MFFVRLSTFAFCVGIKFLRTCPKKHFTFADWFVFFRFNKSLIKIMSFETRRSVSLSRQLSPFFGHLLSLICDDLATEAGE